MDRFTTNLQNLAQANKAKERLPLTNLVGRKKKAWFLCYEHSPSFPDYVHRLAFHQGSKPVKSITTSNYFEMLLEEPEVQIPAMAETLFQFLNGGNHQALPLNGIWKFVLYLAGGKVLDSTLWLKRKPRTTGHSLFREHREMFYGLARQPKHGGLLTILESKDANFRTFASSGSSHDFNWLSLTLQSGQELAAALNEFKPPKASV